MTKCDILDDTMMQQLYEHLPQGIDSIFISSVSNFHIQELKDLIFQKLQAEVIATSPTLDIDIPSNTQSDPS